MIRTITAAVMLCALAFSPAHAKKLLSPGSSKGMHPMCNVTMPCDQPSASTLREVRTARGKYVARQLGIGGPVTAKPQRHGRANPGQASASGQRSELVAHPAGCPSRAFCGCGAAVRVFGAPVRALWLASEWLRRFPRAQPAPGMVAARPGHVFVLEQHIAGDTWLTYDANSGGHATRIHARSIAGYAIVDPHGARV